MKEKNLGIVTRNLDNEIPINTDNIFNRGELENTIKNFSLNSNFENNELPNIPTTIIYIEKIDEGKNIYTITPEPKNVSENIEGEYTNG